MQNIDISDILTESEGSEGRGGGINSSFTSPNITGAINLDVDLAEVERETNAKLLARCPKHAGLTKI